MPKDRRSRHSNYRIDVSGVLTMDRRSWLDLIAVLFILLFFCKLRQSLLLETTILSVRTPVTRSCVKTPGTTILELVRTAKNDDP